MPEVRPGVTFEFACCSPDWNVLQLACQPVTDMKNRGPFERHLVQGVTGVDLDPPD